MNLQGSSIVSSHRISSTKLNFKAVSKFMKTENFYLKNLQNTIDWLANYAPYTLGRKYNHPSRTDVLEQICVALHWQ